MELDGVVWMFWDMLGLLGLAVSRINGFFYLLKNGIIIFG